jgi:hypothetical protein
VDDIDGIVITELPVAEALPVSEEDDEAPISKDGGSE